MKVFGWLEILEACGWGSKVEGVRPGRTRVKVDLWHAEIGSNVTGKQDSKYKSQCAQMEMDNHGIQTARRLLRITVRAQRGAWRVKHIEWCLFPRQHSFPQCLLIFLPLIPSGFHSNQSRISLHTTWPPSLYTSYDPYTNTHVIFRGGLWQATSCKQDNRERPQGFSCKSQ